MKEQQLDALLITDMKNIYYLTGFSGTAGTVFLTASRSIFITDSRYIGVARSIIKDFEVIESREALGYITENLMVGVSRLAFEDSVDFAFYQELSEKLRAELVPTHDFVMTFRQIKDEEEIAATRKACEMTDQAFSEVLNFIKPGRTELEVANFLDFKMRELGASGLSFDTIVASGKRSSLPHGVATRKVIEYGDAVTMDFGCFYEHYASDMTRTVFVGAADERLVGIYEIVRQANEKLIERAKAGMSLADFDKIPRELIERAGYGQYFTHGIGHGVGLDIHEIPYFGAQARGKLEAGMIVTDEPGIYLPDFGGVRIEDDLLITEKGCEVLTKSPKELLVI